MARYPTNGRDEIHGSDHRGDYISAKGGNDKVYGRGGNDTLDGDAGSDYVDGGRGRDKLVWDSGENGRWDRDTYKGGQGEDTLVLKLDWSDLSGNNWHRLREFVNDVEDGDRAHWNGLTASEFEHVKLEFPGNWRGNRNDPWDDDNDGRGRGNDGRGDDDHHGRGNDGRGNDGRGNDGRGDDDHHGRGNDGRGNDGDGHRGNDYDRHDVAQWDL